jgi:hypothetical protein
VTYRTQCPLCLRELATDRRSRSDRRDTYAHHLRRQLHPPLSPREVAIVADTMLLSEYQNDSDD